MTVRDEIMSNLKVKLEPTEKGQYYFDFLCCLASYINNVAEKELFKMDISVGEIEERLKRFF